MDRAVYLLGQCVNYASTKEEENGRADVQRRLDDASKMWEKLEEFAECFKKHDRRLPTSERADSPFAPIWINPAAASGWYLSTNHAEMKLIHCQVLPSKYTISPNFSSSSTLPQSAE